MHTPTRRRPRLAPTRLALACAAALAAAPAHAANYTWTGGAGGASSFWDLAANWSPGLPNGTDAQLLLGAFNTTLRSGTFDVGAMQGTGALTITGGELRLNASASTIGSLHVNGGRIVAPGSVTVRDFHWNTGEFSPDFFGDAPSKLIVTGSATFGNGGTKYMGYHSMLDLRGRANWLDGASQVALDGNLLVGAAGRIDDRAHSAGHHLHLGGNFRNDGTYVKTGQAITDFSMPFGGAVFDNAGNFLVREGTVNIVGSPSGDWHNSGLIEVSRGATLNVNVFRWSPIEQSGTVRVNGQATVSVMWSGMTSTGKWVVSNSGSLRFANDRFDEWRSMPIDFSGGGLVNYGTLVFDGGETFLRNGAAITGNGVVELRNAAKLSTETSLTARLLRADGLYEFPGGPGAWGSLAAPDLKVQQLDWGIADLHVPGRIRVVGDARLHGGPVYFGGDGSGPAQPGYRKVIDGWLTVGGHTTWSGETDLVGSGRITTTARRLFVDQTPDELPTDFDAPRPVELGVARFENNGTYLKTGAGDVQATGTFVNAGALRTYGSGRMIFTGTLDNRGTLEARGARIDVRGSLAQWSGADRRLTGGTYVANGNAISIDLGHDAGIARNSARIELRGATAALLNSHGGVDRNALSSLSINDGSLKLLSGASLANTAGLANRGTVLLGSGSALDIGGLYRQSGHGQTWINGVLQADAIEFAGGLWGAGENGTVGTASLSGSQVKLSAGRLDVDIAGTSLYDVVTIDGLALLGGTLFADFADTDFAEGVYRVLTASGGLSGSFSMLTNLDLSQYSVNLVYGTHQVDLQVTRTTSPLATAAMLPMAPVPEPETYALMLAGLALIVWRRRRRGLHA